MRKQSLLVTIFLLGFSNASLHAASFATAVFASGTSVNATAPDSVTAGNGSVWVAYTNGADSTGLSGSSTVVQYSSTGSVLRTFSFAGYVDGLKINPANGNVWVLQNQDGNSKLAIINTVTNTAGPSVPYAVTNSTRGYDDVVFEGSNTYLSYTNPVSGTDPIIQQLVNGSNPLTISSNLLTMGASGTNLVTGLTGMISASDPDSLKTTPNGTLMLTSGDDGQLIFVANPGVTNTVGFLQLLDPSSGKAVSGLDDAIFPTAGSGIFYVADTGNNRILAVHGTGLTTSSLYADVGSLNEFGLVSTSTGVVSAAVVTAAGVNLNSPHGIDFVADTPEPATLSLTAFGLLSAALLLKRRS